MWMYLLTVLLVVGVKERIQLTPLEMQGHTKNRKEVRNKKLALTTKIQPWSMKRLPWWYHMVRILCVVWMTTREYYMTHHTGVFGEHIWSRRAEPKGDLLMRWNIHDA